MKTPSGDITTSSGTAKAPPSDAKANSEANAENEPRPEAPWTQADATKQRAFDCSCEACVRDGLHEPSCRVHARPPGACDCGRADQSKGAG